MITIRVTFADGNTLVTSINGSLERAREYYIGRQFELHEDKPRVLAVSVDQIV